MAFCPPLDYNGLRRPEKIIGPNATEILLDYNDQGRLLSRTVGDRTTLYNYDAAGVLQSVDLPDHRRLDYGYWPSGRLKTVTDTRGNFRQLTWDAVGNIQDREVYSSRYIEDAEGIESTENVLEMAIHAAVDSSGRPWKTWNDIDATEMLPAEELLYDAAGNLEEFRDRPRLIKIGGVPISPE